MWLIFDLRTMIHGINTIQIVLKWLFEIVNVRILNVSLRSILISMRESMIPLIFMILITKWCNSSKLWCRYFRFNNILVNSVFWYKVITIFKLSLLWRILFIAIWIHPFNYFQWLDYSKNILFYITQKNTFFTHFYKSFKFSS